MTATKGTIQMSIFDPRSETLERVKSWLDGLPDQRMGDASAISDCGEPYQAFSAFALHRPGDEAVAIYSVARQMRTSLERYFEGRNGEILWRIPLEWVTEKHPVVEKWDDNGPDVDYLSGRRCVMDKNWLSVRAYCRLYRANLKRWRLSVEPK